jgi:hypothetical protein
MKADSASIDAALEGGIMPGDIEMWKQAASWWMAMQDRTDGYMERHMVLPMYVVGNAEDYPVEQVERGAPVTNACQLLYAFEQEVLALNQGQALMPIPVYIPHPTIFEKRVLRHVYDIAKNFEIEIEEIGNRTWGGARMVIADPNGYVGAALAEGRDLLTAEFPDGWEKEDETRRRLLSTIREVKYGRADEYVASLTAVLVRATGLQVDHELDDLRRYMYVAMGAAIDRAARNQDQEELNTLIPIASDMGIRISTLGNGVVYIKGDTEVNQEYTDFEASTLERVGQMIYDGEVRLVDDPNGVRQLQERNSQLAEAVEKLKATDTSPVTGDAG